jgi:hypothetical protein
MKGIVAAWISAEKAPILPLTVEKPPVDKVEKACVIASKTGIPKAMNTPIKTEVRKPYTRHSSIIDFFNEGLMLPGSVLCVSAENKLLEIPPDSLITAMKNVSMPRPPTHCIKPRQNNKE